MDSAEWFTVHGWMFAGLLAAAVSYLELAASLQRFPAPATAFFVFCRLAIEAGAASVIFRVVIEAFRGLAWFNLPIAIILCGFCGPALLRAQLALLGSGQEERALGPANGFRRVRKAIDSLIVDIDVVSVDRWISTTVVPSLRMLEGLELTDRIGTYFEAKHKRKKADDLIAQLKSISGTHSPLTDDDRRAIVHFVFVNHGKRLIKSIAKTARRDNQS